MMNLIILCLEIVADSWITLRIIYLILSFSSTIRCISSKFSCLSTLAKWLCGVSTSELFRPKTRWSKHWRIATTMNWANSGHLRHFSWSNNLGSSFTSIIIFRLVELIKFMSNLMNSSFCSWGCHWIFVAIIFIVFN